MGSRPVLHLKTLRASKGFACDAGVTHVVKLGCGCELAEPALGALGSELVQGFLYTWCGFPGNVCMKRKPASVHWRL